MALENRNLEVGTRLVGRYKKQDHFAEVVQGEDGGILYRLEDGREFKSLSAAGTAVTGKSCNGWQFWSPAGANNEVAQAKAEDRPKARRKRDRVIRPTKTQEGVPEGYVRYFCNACADTFIVEGSEEPESCPAGHGAELVPAEEGVD